MNERKDLGDKIKDDNPLRPLGNEELGQMHYLAIEEIEAALECGRRDLEALQRGNYPRILHSDLRYK